MCVWPWLLSVRDPAAPVDAQTRVCESQGDPLAAFLHHSLCWSKAGCWCARTKHIAIHAASADPSYRAHSVQGPRVLLLLQVTGKALACKDVGLAGHDITRPEPCSVDGAELPLSGSTLSRSSRDRALEANAQVFGKVLVCKDLDVAGRAAHTSSLNCVTIKGDQVSKKGTITGGFRDIKRWVTSPPAVGGLQHQAMGP